HWGFAFLLTASIALALVADEGSRLFQWHMLCGLGAASLLILRLISGVAGSRHARFAAFPLSPQAVMRYFRGVVTGTADRYAGHNPGSALAALAMFALVGILVITGLGMGREEMEELHEPVAYALMAVIGLHLAGLIAHTVRHRENIAVSMVTGRKLGHPDQAVVSARPVWGLAFLIVGVAWIVGLFAAHDPRAATTRLPLSGTVLALGERESQGDRHEGDERGHGRGHDED
ncbi:MAG: cytochrome b/b6 domain-containing protein, partial [Verrucomicrobiales bacterium]|nr:cytochrome b/b6 domain-containing protein [Verrucomicrobiales bacterium]